MPSDHRAPRSRAPLWLRIAVLAASIVLALCALEGAVRVRQWMQYGTSTGEAFQLVADRASGLFIPKPGQDTGRIRINSQGFRGPEIPRTKPPGTVRLAFLGGSTTFCAEVSGNENTWPALVTRGLGERYPGVKFDYVNAGVPGYGLGSMRKNLERRVAPFRPDIIFFYEATNDMASDTRELAARRGLYSDMTKDSSPLAKISVAWFLIERRMIRQQQEKAARSGITLAYDPDSLAHVFGERLAGCLQAAKAVAPVYAVATFSHKMRRDQSPQVALANSAEALFYSPYTSVAELITSFDAYNRAIREVADSTGAILIDGEDTIPGDDIHFADSVHFTDEGARTMAARVLGAVEEAPEFRKLVAERAREAGSR
jgi:lysophospholipase L1-like esterase